jgi:hypothetical protein
MIHVHAAAVKNIKIAMVLAKYKIIIKNLVIARNEAIANLQRMRLPRYRSQWHSLICI